MNTLDHALPDYKLFTYALQGSYPSIQKSTLVVVHQASDAATVEGELSSQHDVRLRVLEAVRFDLAPPRILRHGYEVRRGEKKLYWCDPQPHPGDPPLASTHPHYKHVPPDVKHHRVPAPALSFTQRSLPLLIEEKTPEILQYLPGNGDGWTVHDAFFSRAGLIEAAKALAETHAMLQADLKILDRDLWESSVGT